MVPWDHPAKYQYSAGRNVEISCYLDDLSLRVTWPFSSRKEKSWKEGDKGYHFLQEPTLSLFTPRCV